MLGITVTRFETKKALHRTRTYGFALPTVIVTSTILFAVLVAGMSTVSSVRATLTQQYHDALARDATESGLAMARFCLEKNNYVATWSTASPLRPNTSCNGGAACSNSPSCYVVSNGRIRTTFSVGSPESTSPNGTQTIKVNGTVSMVRSGGATVTTSSSTQKGQFGAEVSMKNIGFGYYTTNGSYFATIDSKGILRGVGYNTEGQLGNGTTNPTLVPREFIAVPGERPVAIYTSMVSMGFNLFVVMASGNVYGTGMNNYGQLGRGTITSYETTLGKFNLPVGVTAQSVSVGGWGNFIIGSNNNVYSAGWCDRGFLGDGAAISGCSNKSSYRRVTLPTVNLADSNTIPTSNLSVDNRAAIIRMLGGRVYAWGSNDRGQLGNGTTTHSPTPLKVGTFGDSGKPKAKQVATDGRSSWILDDTGAVWGMGSNDYGELGGIGIEIYHSQAGKCLDNAGNNGVNLRLWTCNSSTAQKFTFMPDGTIVHQDDANIKCMTIVYNSSWDRDVPILANCNALDIKQRFITRANDNGDMNIYSLYNLRCLDNRSGNGTDLIFAGCGGTNGNQVWSLSDVSTPVKAAIPASAGKVIKIAADGVFLVALTESGQVWGVGWNNNGQLGNGTISDYQVAPVQFQLPAGVTAKDITVTSHDGVAENTFVIGSNGRIYGAGSNNYGQLGIGSMSANVATPTAMQVINGSGIAAKEVVSGKGTTVIYTTNGRVYTVGNNDYGQLGDGTQINKSVPAANTYTNVINPTIY